MIWVFFYTVSKAIIPILLTLYKIYIIQYFCSSKRCWIAIGVYICMKKKTYNLILFKETQFNKLATWIDQNL